MGARTIHSIVKPIAKADYAQAIQDAIVMLPGSRPRDRPQSEFGYAESTRQIVGVHINDTLVLSDEAWKLAAHMAEARNLLWMELRMQEGDHWDFTLHRGTELIADFSTRVLYWNDDGKAVRPWKHGDLYAFASAWGIDPERVAPYLIDWDRPRKFLDRFRRRKEVRSMPDDKYSIGDVYQIFDFMRVIDTPSPFGHDDNFVFNVPCWKWGRRTTA